MKRTRRAFTRANKLAAVKKVIEQGLSISEVARHLSIRETLIRNWRKAFEADRMLQAEVNPSPSVEAELERLRQENRQLKMERDIVLKATAYFGRLACVPMPVRNISVYPISRRALAHGSTQSAAER
jgi:transposase-like protein